MFISHTGVGDISNVCLYVYFFVRDGVSVNVILSVYVCVFEGIDVRVILCVCYNLSKMSLNVIAEV